MRIIPVLDLKGGQVVRAAQGQRDLYRPIRTPLAATSDPVDVAHGLRNLYPFDTFYCADLDAIEGRPANSAALLALGQMAQPPALWIDAGIAEAETLQTALFNESVRAVLGSESQLDIRLLEAFCDHPRIILSLDFFADGFRGPAEILERPEVWPSTVIVMTLAKVGSAAGPDYTLLGDIKARAGGRAVVAAGGIRNEADIRRLRELGVAAALIATSLHDGTLTATHLASLGA